MPRLSQKRDALFALADDLVSTDQLRYDHLPYLRDSTARRIYARKPGWQSALEDIGKPNSDLGDLTQWAWFPLGSSSRAGRGTEPAKLEGQLHSANT